MLTINEFTSLEQYVQHFGKNAAEFSLRSSTLKELEASYPNEAFTVKGFSYPAQEEVEFQVDWMYSNGDAINWRERLTCPVTQLPNRLRASFHLLQEYLECKPNDCIYLTEQLTPFYQFLNARYEHVIGSEYISSKHQPGSVDNDIRHEDFTNLSFQTDSIDFILSFDCLEHIPDFQDAIKETHRALKTGGKFLFSFPFHAGKPKHIIRATIDKNGEINHLLEPEYHGDPINENGCLSFYTFGWEILNDFEKAGFSNCKMITLWSQKYGYLGDEQVFLQVKNFDFLP